MGRRTPLKSSLSTNQLSNIPCASPGAEVVMKCCVEDVLGLFARHSCSYIDTVRRGLVLTKFALKRAFGEDLNQLLFYGDGQAFDLTAVNVKACSQQNCHPEDEGSPGKDCLCPK